MGGTAINSVTDERRDLGLDDTDSFRVIVDGLLDRQNGLVFGTNPVGMEYDAQVVRAIHLGWASGTRVNIKPFRVEAVF